jgi:two-component system, OmpR family, sensor histidine kinase VicK
MNANESAVIQKLVTHSEECFLVYNIGEKRFSYANAAFEEITHFSRRQLLEDPGSMIEAIHQDDREMAVRIFGNLLRKTSPTLLEFRIFRPDKTERWIRMKVYLVPEDDRPGYLTAIMTDDTARKTSLFNMQKITGWKDSLLEIMAHDLRGPMGIVRMLASAINAQPDANKNPMILKWTKMIHDITQRNIDLIASMLKKETLEQANAATSMERIDLVWEIGEIMKMYVNSTAMAARQITFTHSHESIFALADSVKFIQIINNLVSNALKFTRDDGHICVHIEKLDNTASISVADDGIGIPRKLQPFLFNKHTKAGRTGLDGQESVGLGMWIVKALTDAHGGRVWVESEENEGTTVYVEIPTRDQEA